MKKVGIIGSGTMGIGIAQVAATAHCEVFLYDANFSQTEKSLKNLKTTLNKLAEKGKISAEKSLEIFNQIKPCQEIKELKDCDLVIEASSYLFAFCKYIGIFKTSLILGYISIVSLISFAFLARYAALS